MNIKQLTIAVSLATMSFATGTNAQYVTEQEAQYKADKQTADTLTLIAVGYAVFMIIRELAKTDNKNETPVDKTLEKNKKELEAMSFGFKPKNEDEPFQLIIEKRF